MTLNESNIRDKARVLKININTVTSPAKKDKTTFFGGCWPYQPNQGLKSAGALPITGELLGLITPKV